MTRKILICSFILFCVASSCRVRSSSTATTLGTATTITSSEKHKRDTVVVNTRDTLRTYTVKDTTYYIHHYTTNDIHHYSEHSQVVKRDTVYLQTKTYEVKPKEPSRLRLIDWLIVIGISAALTAGAILFARAKIK